MEVEIRRGRERLNIVWEGVNGILRGKKRICVRKITAMFMDLKAEFEIKLWRQRR